MSDAADRANRQMEFDRTRATEYRRPVPDLEARGTCHWCEAPVGPRQKFCDDKCADDWERDWMKHQGDH